ncbi:hypothetical protein [Ornithobacterium rhinotracheale]
MQKFLALIFSILIVFAPMEIWGQAGNISPNHHSQKTMSCCAMKQHTNQKSSTEETKKCCDTSKKCNNDCGKKACTSHVPTVSFKKSENHFKGFLPKIQEGKNKHFMYQDLSVQQLCYAIWQPPKIK